MRVKLGVNVDHVASIRQARGTKYPDPVFAAYLAELGGADQITVHLREDRRHIQERDLAILRKTVSTALNLEMAVTDEMLEIACSIKPDMATLVPEKREEKTTEGGLDVSRDLTGLKKFIGRLRKSGVVVSIFVDPDPKQIELSVKTGAERIEIHTGFYCDAHGREIEREFERIRKAAKKAASLGLGVAAGHGLDYHNVEKILTIPEIDELNIGHSIVSRAVFVGIERAVREMKEILEITASCRAP